MPKKPAKKSDQNGFWTSTSTKLGVLSAALGIVLSVIQVVVALRPDKQQELKNTELAQKVSEYAPRFEVSYLSMSQELFQNLKERNKGNNQKQLDFLAYPVLLNEVANDELEPISEIPEAGMGDTENDENMETRVMCLVLQNKGKSDALNVQINAERLTLNTEVDFQESISSQGVNIESKIKENGTSSNERSFMIPNSIETGSGVLIPLFVTRNPPRYLTQVHHWKLSSTVVYLPKIITFTDPLDNKVKTFEVRKMRHPIRTDNGIEIRG